MMKQNILVTSSASFISAVITSLILHPLDVVKTRQQVTAISGGAVVAYPSMILSIKYIVSKEGLKGLYKGVQGQLIASGVSWFVFRYWFDKIRYKINMNNSLLDSNIVNNKVKSTSYLLLNTTSANSLPFNISPLSNAIATLIAGSLSTSLVHPLWLLKTRLEMQSLDSKTKGWTQYSSGIKGWYKCLTDVYMKNGIRGLYSGYFPALMLVPHSLIQLVIYDELRHYWKCNFDNQSFLLNSLSPFIWGFIAKFIAAVITYPLQVIRARKQMIQTTGTESKIFWQPNNGKCKYSVFYRLYILFSQHLYAGITTHIPKVCLHSGIMFLIYETLLGIYFQIL
ncbi:carrier protein [Cryptosporidium andersoni]|uniref:Carrier protein n=1 Tax=Cryptosporidium andersoni TaxID=117008 RepID=A0A1J4MAA6_9CRYT|nr:carrier protein [Cryptosporidium andersoni]